LMAMPLIGTRAVPVRIRVLVAGALAMALSPMLPPVPGFAGIDAATVLGVARALALGVAMGFCLRLVFEAGAFAGELVSPGMGLSVPHMDHPPCGASPGRVATSLPLGFCLRLVYEAGAFAGELVSQGMGLSFAQMNDPLRGTSSGVVAQWFYLAFGLLFFASDGHLAIIAMLVRSYQALPIGADWSVVASGLSVPVALCSAVLRGGLGLALPLMMAMLATNLTFGVLAKAAPSLHPVQLGLPVAVLTGFFLLAMLAGEIAQPMQALFDRAFE